MKLETIIDRSIENDKDQSEASNDLRSPCCAAGVWRHFASMEAWAEWRSLMSASPGRSRCPAGVSLRRWSGRWGRQRANCLHTEQPSPAHLSFRPSWGRPPSSPCSYTSVSCSRGCPSVEVSRRFGLFQLLCDVGWSARCHVGQKRMCVFMSQSGVM